MNTRFKELVIKWIRKSNRPSVVGSQPKSSLPGNPVSNTGKSCHLIHDDTGTGKNSFRNLLTKTEGASSVMLMSIFFLLVIKRDLLT